MKHLLPQKLPSFDNASILVVGDIMLDRYWFGDTSRISPEAPVPIIKVNSDDHRPGGAGNVALNIAALGAQVTLLGITGRDEAAKRLTEQLICASVNHDFCQFDDLKTIIKLRVISRHQQLLRIDFEEKPLTIDKNILIERYKNHLAQANLVILSDYNKGTLSDPQTLIQLARKAHIPVLVDPKGLDFSIYQHANLITPNFKEFETIVGSCRDEEDILNKGRALLKKYSIDTLLITRGEDGMTLINQHDAHHLSAYAHEVFDVTGAGDTVISILGAALAAQMDCLSATALANLAAGIVIGKLGAASISALELQAALTHQTHLTTGVVNEEQLLQILKDVRAQNKKIIFTNGCFDVLHAGHVAYLQQAKQLGDYLIVAVNDDASIRKLKGENRPINSLENRMIVLAGLHAVDWVLSFSDDTPERLLQLIKPDFLVKGGDYQLDQIVGAQIVRSYGGEVHRIMSQDISLSSTKIMNRIKNPSGDQPLYD